jgi:hypothetical protein
VRKYLLTGLGAALGLLLAGPAHAESFSVNGVGVGLVPPTGTYKVTATRDTTADPFTITVKSNNNAGGMIDVSQISISFFTGKCLVSPTVDPSAGNGVTAGGGASDPAANGVWAFNAGVDAAFQGGMGVRVLSDATNDFTGQVVLSTLDEIKSIKVDLTGGASQTYQGCDETNTGVPEPGALALALPGLLPLGLMLRRKRAKAAGPSA